MRSAKALGASDLRIMFLYVLPAVLPTAIVIAMIELAVLMLVESILSFIGLGIDPPAISWGTALADGRRSLGNAWWMLVFPGMAIFLAVLAINLLADGLADVLDPRLKLSGIVRRAHAARQAVSRDARSDGRTGKCPAARGRQPAASSSRSMTAPSSGRRGASLRAASPASGSVSSAKAARESR